MNCLYDYIGLLGCAPSNTESGLYVNSLPGISLASVDALANAEQATYAAVWAAVQTRAVRRFSTAVNAELRKRFKLKSVRNSINIGRKVNSQNTTALVVGQWRGIIIDLALQDEITQSNLQSIYVQEVSLYLNAVPATDFKIRVYEMFHETGYDDFMAYESTVAVLGLTAGWNRIPVNTSFSSDKIFIAYDATQINSVELKLNELVADSFCSAFSTIYGSCEYASIHGATANLTGDPLSILSTGQNTYGLSALFSIQCKYDNVVCGDKNIFCTALWYLLGVEMQIERLNSTRINQWTMDVKQAMALLDHYQIEFEKELETAVAGIDVDLSDACVECNEPIKVIQSTP